MKVNITAKGFKVNSRLSKHLNFHLQKISERLPNLKSDLPSLKFLVRKSIKKYYNKKDYPSLAHFEGSISLQLPKKSLFVTFSGRSVSECIESGISRLKKEFEKYKDLHFKSQSQYPNHLSIRGAKVYG